MASTLWASLKGNQWISKNAMLDGISRGDVSVRPGGIEPAIAGKEWLTRDQAVAWVNISSSIPGNRYITKNTITILDTYYTVSVNAWGQELGWGHAEGDVYLSTVLPEDHSMVNVTLAVHIMNPGRGLETVIATASIPPGSSRAIWTCFYDSASTYQGVTIADVTPNPNGRHRYVW